MSSIIPARFYKGDLDELRYSNPDWWQDEVNTYLSSLTDKTDTLTNNELTVFDID
jgi:hypothetical protein